LLHAKKWKVVSANLCISSLELQNLVIYHAYRGVSLCSTLLPVRLSVRHAGGSGENCWR